MIAHDKLLGLARLVRLLLVVGYHSIEAAEGHIDKPMQVALVDMFEVVRPLHVVVVVLLALVLVGMQVTSVAVVQGHNSPEGIVQMEGRSDKRGLQVEFDLWEIDTAKVFEGTTFEGMVFEEIAFGVQVVPSKKREIDLLIASLTTCLSFDLLNRRLMLCFRRCA